MFHIYPNWELIRFLDIFNQQNYLLDSISEHLNSLAHDTSSWWALACSIVIGGATVWISYANIKNQNINIRKQFIQQHKQFRKQLEENRKQWINEEYIKRESKLLIELHNMLLNAHQSFFWYIHIFFEFGHFVGFTPTEQQRTISVEELKQNFKNLSEINNFFNQNQLICRKYQFETLVEYIIVILQAHVWLETQDLTSVFIQKNGDEEIYHLLGKDKIEKSILFGMNFLLHPESFPQIPPIDSVERKQLLEKYKNLMVQAFLNTQIKLEEKITFFEGNIPPQLKVRSMRTYSIESMDIFQQHDKK